MRSNYHTHCYLDDGVSEPREYVENALNADFTSLGFSCHAPLPFSNEWTLTKDNLPVYMEAIKTVREEYRGKIQIYRGLEVDYIPGVMGPSSDWVNDLNLDYKIGSVHMIKNPETGNQLSFDGPDSEFNQLLNQVFGGDIRKMVKKYYEIEIRMMDEHDFDILGHCDLIKKKNSGNRYFDQNESWYQKDALKMLETAADKKVIIEINTGAIARGIQTEFYPSPWMLKKARDLKIPITLNSDCHFPEKITAAYKESFQIIKDIGFKELQIINDGEWTGIKL